LKVSREFGVIIFGNPPPKSFRSLTGGTNRNTAESGGSISSGEAWEFDNRLNPPRYLNPDDAFDRMRDFGFVKIGYYKERKRVNIGWTRRY
jgi:hypothetical protein